MDWEQLAIVAADADTLAPELRERQSDLARAFALAKLRNDPARAARILRWLTPGAEPPDPGPLPSDRSSNDLRDEIERGARAWLETNRRHFAMPPIGSPQELDGIKALGEVALVVRLMRRAAERRNDPRLAKFADELFAFAWRELDDGARIERIVERTPALGLLVIIYALFHRLGGRSASLERVLARSLPAVPDTIRMMAARSAEMIGIAPPWTVEESIGWTAFGNTRPPWTMTRAQVYETTHVLFSLTDFGAVPLEREVPYMRLWLPVWLRFFLDAKHYDLVAELISAWHCVDGACPPHEAWAALRAVQREGGSIPYAAERGLGRDYHSTLMALAAALVCSHG